MGGDWGGHISFLNGRPLVLRLYEFGTLIVRARDGELAMLEQIDSLLATNSHQGYREVKCLACCTYGRPNEQEDRKTGICLRESL